MAASLFFLDIARMEVFLPPTSDSFETGDRIKCDIGSFLRDCLRSPPEAVVEITICFIHTPTHKAKRPSSFEPKSLNEPD